jgi:hypothetical protein
MKSFSTTLTPEQLPFVISRLANANVRRMVEERGPVEALKAIIADEKQYKMLFRIIDEEFGLLPTLHDVKVGTWAQFVEAKHRRTVIGEVKSVTRAGIKVKEYHDMGARAGWAPTGNEWTILPDLNNGFLQVEAKMTVEQKVAARAAEQRAAEAKTAKTVIKAAEAPKVAAAEAPKAGTAEAPKAIAAEAPKTVTAEAPKAGVAEAPKAIGAEAPAPKVRTKKAAVKETVTA